jgi:hypothetical protein
MKTRVSKDPLDDLARRLPAAAERDLPAGQQHLRQQLVREFRQAGNVGRPAPRWSRWSRRPRIAVPAVAAALVAAGASAALVAASLSAAPSTSPTATPVRGSAAHPAPAAPSTPAAQLLAKIAVAVGRQPTPVVGNSDYEYIKSVQHFEVYVVGKNGKQSHYLGPALIRQFWMPVYDLCRPIGIYEPGNIAGHPTMQSSDKTPGKPCPQLGSMADPTYQWETSAPADPHVLLGQLAAYWRAFDRKYPPGPGDTLRTREFDAIGQMVAEAILPPKFSAALYRTAALIPGVAVIPDVVNAVGQHGVAIAMLELGQRTEWIFDKATLLPIGERDVDVKTGAVTGTSAILASGFVAKIGQVPGGQH